MRPKSPALCFVTIGGSRQIKRRKERERKRERESECICQEENLGEREREQLNEPGEVCQVKRESAIAGHNTFSR